VDVVVVAVVVVAVVVDVVVVVSAVVVGVLVVSSEVVVGALVVGVRGSLAGRLVSSFELTSGAPPNCRWRSFVSAGRPLGTSAN
jgi:hypothetical protein